MNDKTWNIIQLSKISETLNNVIGDCEPNTIEYQKLKNSYETINEVIYSFYIDSQQLKVKL